MTTPESGDYDGIVSEDSLRELAGAGALCQECGGICISVLDTAILVLAATGEAGVTIPWCSCSECPVCGSFQNSIEPLAAVSELNATTERGT